MIDISEILIFKLSGKLANFKKFYSNKSSLTYKIPTRTVLMGIVASIMEEERNSYYEWLSPQNSKFGIKIAKPGRTHFECMNYLNSKKSGDRTQTRLELLIPREDRLEYRIYFWCNDSEKLRIFEEKLIDKDFGYGVYLGQRQFRGDIDYIDKVKKDNIEIINEFTGKNSTLTYSNNIIKLNNQSNIKLISDRMPICFSKDNEKSDYKEILRIPEKKDDMIFEENGREIEGKFREVIRVKHEYISFYTPLSEVLECN